jgi:adenine-specific DNA-methyltransferase
MIKREVVIGDCRLLLGDCREILPTLDCTADAIITDPPYHGVKRDGWDNQWKTDEAFLDWAGNVAAMLRKLAAHNASIYWFASPQMASRLEVILAEKFRILNNIVWDKSGRRKGVGGTGIDVTALRGYWSANTERVIFGECAEGDIIAHDVAGYEQSCVSAKTSVFGDYLRSEFKRAGVTNKQIAALFPSKTGGMTGCVSNWLLGLNVPTPEQYETIREFLGGHDYLKREYDYLKREYEDLKREYEDLRRPFFLSPQGEWGDVWRFDIERETVHPTQKPQSLMRHIVKVSSRPGDTVLDPFAGSGSTGVSCANLGRSFVGIEQDPTYFDIACERIRKAYAQPDMFIETARVPEPTQEALSL